MRCEVCGAPSELHVTDVDEHGGVTERHFCRSHGKAVGVSFPSDQELAARVLPELRGMVEFMRAHRRMPSIAEAREGGLGLFAAEWEIEPGGEDFRRLLAHLEDVVAVVEVEGRLPGGGEVPGVP